MSKAAFRRWWAIARVIISLGLLVAVLLTIGLDELWATVVGASLLPLLAALAFFVCGVVVRAARWRALLVALDVRVPFRRLVYLYFSGAFFNLFLPTGFGGDVVRIVELAQEAQATAALGTVVVDRLTGILVLFAMALVALPFGGELLSPQARLLVGLFAAAGLAFGGLVLQGNWLRRLVGWLPGPLSLRGEGALARAYAAVTACGWRAVGQALFFSLIFNILLILVNYLAALAVGMRVSLVYFLIFVPVLSVTLMLPISVGGLGVRETTAALLFAQIGVDQAVAVAASLAVYAVSALTSLFGGMLYLLQSLRALGGKASANHKGHEE